MTQPSDYLQQNVRGILQPMVSAVLSEKPKDPVKKNIFINYILKKKKNRFFS